MICLELKELALGQSMERQAMAVFEESRKFLLTNMSAIGNRSVNF